MMSNNQLLCYVILIFTFLSAIENGDCSGHVRTKIVSYTDYRPNGGAFYGYTKDISMYSCKPSDRCVFFCLYFGSISSNCVSNNFTVPLPDQTNDTFGSTNGSSSICYQYDLHFGVPFKGLSLLWLIKGQNMNSTLEPDYNETNEFAFSGEKPVLYQSNPNFTTHFVSFNHSRLIFQYSIQCDANFYGNCDQYCQLSQRVKSCDDQGNSTCHVGWKGSNCSIPDCSNRTCDNGGTCAKNTNTCLCLHNYTGAFCDYNTTDDAHNTDVMRFETSTHQAVTSSTEPSSASSGDKHNRADASASDQTAVYVGASIGSVAALAVILGIVAYLVKKQKKTKLSIRNQTERETNSSNKSHEGI